MRVKDFYGLNRARNLAWKLRDATDVPGWIRAAAGRAAKHYTYLLRFQHVESLRETIRSTLRDMYVSTADRKETLVELRKLFDSKRIFSVSVPGPTVQARMDKDGVMRATIDFGDGR